MLSIAIKEADLGFLRKMSLSKKYRNNCQMLVLMAFICKKQE